MDSADLIDSFLTGTFQVTRTQPGSFDRGRAELGPASTFPIRANWQPATGRDLQRLPEGQRDVETRVLYTVTQLQVGSGPAGKADQVEIDGEAWEVQQVQRWAGVSSVEKYFRCILQAVR